MKVLDTDVVVNMLRERRYEAGAISTITLIEVLRGVAAEKRGEVKKLLEEAFEVLPLDNRAIETYCSLYNELKGGGESIPDADLLIAATAISQDAILRTGDRHFERLKKLGLKLQLDK